MPADPLSKFFLRVWSVAHPGIDAQDTHSLFHAGVHTMRLTARRASMIVARVQFVSVLMVVTILLSMVINLVIHASGIPLALVIPPFVAATAFLVIAVGLRGRHSLQNAQLALLSLFALAVVFDLFMHFQLASAHPDRLHGSAAVYVDLPFVLLAALALFPLTVVEGCWLAGATLLAQAVTLWPALGRGDWGASLTPMLFLIMVGVIAVLAGLSQLSSLILLVREGIHDSLTGCYSRGCGEELMDLQYTWAERSHSRLAVAQVSLDRFQEVNVRFGYRIGDSALTRATEALHDSMRSGDMLIRWTGDQFLLVLPNATVEQAAEALQRLMSAGLGMRPDGVPLTASIGVSERTHDGTPDWWKLVDLAESRVRVARERGGNCTVANGSPAAPPVTA